MSSLWERFEGIASAEEVAEAKNTFEPIKAGDYTVTLEELAPAESKDGLPMLKGKFRTEENRIIFFNQNIQNLNYPNMTAVNIAEAVAFIGSIMGKEITFTGLSALAKLVETIKLGGKYIVKVSYAVKDTENKFPKVKVVGTAVEVMNNDALPF